MKKALVLVLAAVLLLSMSACHEHEYEGVCEEVGVCKICGCHNGILTEHDWADATCTEPKTCTKCGKTEGEPIEHTVKKWTVTENVDCVKDGEKTGTCTVCGQTVTQVIKSDGTAHNYGGWVVKEKATLENRYDTKTSTCAVCGKVETDKPKVSDADLKALYKSAAKTYTYKEIARDPDKYDGTYAKYTGEVVQVMENSTTYNLRVNITKKTYKYSDTVSYYDTIYVVAAKKSGESRILEGDIITIYGENDGLYTYTSTIGASITLPLVQGEFIEIS